MSKTSEISEPLKPTTTINLETHASRPYGHKLQFIFRSDLARIMLTLHRGLHHADANMSNANADRRFSFFGTSLPPKRGAGWGVGARSSSKKINSCRSSNSSAPGVKRNKYTSDTK